MTQASLSVSPAEYEEAMAYFDKAIEQDWQYTAPMM